MTEDQKTNCPVGVDLKRRVIHLEDDQKTQWDVIDRIRNRLPIWAIFAFSGLTGIVGWLLRSLGK